MQKQLTVQEALAQGYTHVMMEGDTSICKIEDWDFENLSHHTPLLLEPKERTHYTITANRIEGMIIDELENQEEVVDEDGILIDLIDRVDKSLFENLAAALNEAWKQVEFIPPTEIVLVP